MNEDAKQVELSLASLKDRIPIREKVLYVTDHFMTKEEGDVSDVPSRVLDLVTYQFDWDSDEEYDQIWDWIEEWSSDNSITVLNEGDVCTVIG